MSVDAVQIAFPGKSNWMSTLSELHRKTLKYNLKCYDIYISLGNYCDFISAHVVGSFPFGVCKFYPIESILSIIFCMMDLIDRINILV